MKVRPQIGRPCAASLAHEQRLQIGQSDIIRPAVSDNTSPMAALVIRARSCPPTVSCGLELTDSNRFLNGQHGKECDCPRVQYQLNGERSNTRMSHRRIERMDRNYWLLLLASWASMSGVCIAESITGDCGLSLSESAALIASSGLVLGFFVCILHRLDRAVAPPERQVKSSTPSQ